MSHVHKETEIAVRVDRDPNPREAVLCALDSWGIEVHSCGSYRDRSGSVVLLVTDDPSRTQTLLETSGFTCKTDSVVLIETEGHVALASRLGALLGAAGIDILHSYVSRAADRSMVAIFKTSDDENAIQVFEEYLRDAAASGPTQTRPRPPLTSVAQGQDRDGTAALHAGAHAA